MKVTIAGSPRFARDADDGLEAIRSKPNDANDASGEAELALAWAVLSLLLFTHDATRVHGMFADRSKKRVAMLGLMLESNSFSPVTQKDDFLDRLYVAGDEFLEELKKTESKLPTELRAFYAAMNSRIDWAPLPILIGLVEAAGPADHVFYSEVLADMRARLEEAMPLDAVYICNHGAMITTENRDPDGEIFAMVREIVGPDTPIVATLDLHGNVSQRMVDNADVDRRLPHQPPCRHD